MAVAVFDYALWSFSYPELAASVSPSLAGALFRRAGLFLNNTNASIVTDVDTRLDLLNLIVAHLAALGGAGQEGGASGLVGRVTSATEGSVKVDVDAGPSSGSNAWWLQTQYGFQYWQVTAQYRTMRYVPGPVPDMEPWGARWRGAGYAPPAGDNSGGIVPEILAPARIVTDGTPQVGEVGMGVPPVVRGGTVGIGQWRYGTLVVQMGDEYRFAEAGQVNLVYTVTGPNGAIVTSSATVLVAAPFTIYNVPPDSSLPYAMVEGATEGFAAMMVAADIEDARLTALESR